MEVNYSKRSIIKFSVNELFAQLLKVQQSL